MNSVSSVIRKKNKDVIIHIPCEMIAHGVRHCVSGIPGIASVQQLEYRPDKPMSLYSLRPGAIVVLDVNDHHAQRAQTFAFLHAWQIYYPEVRIIALTRNRHPRLLSYLSALGLNAIISLYDPVTVFQAIFIRSMDFCEQVQLSPLIRNLLPEEMPKKLTCREVQVLEKLFNGKSVSMIAEELSRDIRTISTHKRRAMEKLNLRIEKDLHQLGWTVTGK